jgi:hypothetical protein
MGTWVSESFAGRSVGAIAYEQQITGSAGKAFLVNGVKFDGVNASGLLEAKGPGYQKLLSYGLGMPKLLQQATSQLKAANGVPITWHVAEKGAADAIRAAFQKQGIKGINVLFTPAK